MALSTWRYPRDAIHVALSKQRAALRSAEPTVSSPLWTDRYASNFLYLGRGFNFPVALEGALKLKEIS